MRQITNKKQYSEVLVNAIKHATKEYQSGRGETDYSCTQLIDDPTVRRMSILFKDEIVEDVDDLYFTIFGSILHKILEDNAGETDTPEQRWFLDVNGKTVSGQGDHLAADGVMSDYKYTSVFKIKKKQANVEWERQLNVLKYLAESSGDEITKLQIIAYPKDWRKSESMRTEDYPTKETVIEFPIWSTKDAEDYIERQVELHKEADLIDDPEKLPICSDEARWKDEDKWAVKKVDGKRAIKVHEDEDEANKHKEELEEKNPKDLYTIEFRKGTSKRCEEYCRCRFVCPHSPHVEGKKKLDSKIARLVAAKKERNK